MKSAHIIAICLLVVLSKSVKSMYPVPREIIRLIFSLPRTNGEGGLKISTRILTKLLSLDFLLSRDMTIKTNCSELLLDVLKNQLKCHHIGEQLNFHLKSIEIYKRPWEHTDIWGSVLLRNCTRLDKDKMALCQSISLKAQMNIASAIESTIQQCYSTLFGVSKQLSFRWVFADKVADLQESSAYGCTWLDLFYAQACIMHT